MPLSRNSELTPDEEIGEEISIFEKKYEISQEERKIDHPFLNLVIPAGGEAPQISMVDPIKDSAGTIAMMGAYRRKHKQVHETRHPKTRMDSILKPVIDI